MANAKMKKLIVIWVLSCGFFAQAQEVNKDFTKLLLNDQFDQADKNWNSTFNADNLFIAQNGFFELELRFDPCQNLTSTSSPWLRVQEQN